MTRELPEAAPRHRWRIGRCEFYRAHRQQELPRLRGRWGVSDGSIGTGGHLTPFGAWLAYRRWKREAAQVPARKAS